MNTAELVKIAREAQTQAYAPYSGYRVGAALLGAGGQIYTGANVENASYGLTVCGERIAVFKAVLAGERQFQSIAVTSNGSGYIYPCGACLQVLAEFAPQIKVIATNEKNESREYALNELLPQVFTFLKEDAFPGGPLAKLSHAQDKTSGQDDPNRRIK